MDRLFRKIYRTHKKKLKNLDKEGKKLLITFAGIPGSGKSTIAKALEKELEAVRINSIDVEKAYMSLGHKQNIPVKRAYIEWLMNKIAKEVKNKTIILDKGIERTYEDILKWVKDNDYEIFVIGVECKRKTAERRIVTREGEKKAKDYLAEMDRWKREYREYKKLNISHIIMNTEEGNLKEWVDSITKQLNKIK